MMINHSTKTINAWWPKTPLPGNLGDILSPVLIKKLFGYSLSHDAHCGTPHLLSTGSILNRTDRNSTVWGSGIMRLADGVSTSAKYLAVRGPISYEVIRGLGGKCPPIFGDPALLLPKIYNPTGIPKKYKFGITPHYVDYQMVKSWYDKNHEIDIRVINLLNANPLRVVDEMLECENIISSSLHGIIVANAYGIPAKWAKFSDKLRGDDSKFFDYQQSVNIKDAYLPFYEKIDINDFQKFDYKCFETFDSDSLIKSFVLPCILP